MIKVKMCLVCSRLLALNMISCLCGGKEFVEVLLDPDYIGGNNDDIKQHPVKP